MAAQSFELRFATTLGDSLTQLQQLATGFGQVVKMVVDMAQPLAAATTATETLTDTQERAAAAAKVTAETTAGLGTAQEQAAAPASTLATVLQRVGDACRTMETKATGALEAVNAHVPAFAAHLAGTTAEVASFATGMGLAVTPLLLAGSHFGSAGTAAAAAGSLFLIFSARAAAARLAVHGLSDALGLTALRSAVLGGAVSGILPTLARLGPILLEWAPVIAVLAAIYAGVKLFAAGMEEAEARAANFKSLQKVTHDAQESTQALKAVKEAAISTGLSADDLTKAFLALRGTKDATLLTVEGLREIGGMAIAAQKPVGDVAAKIKALYDAIRDQGEDGQKRTREAVKALQDEGVFADVARDKIDALQSAHGKASDALKIARDEIKQYATDAQENLNSVGGQWNRLKTVTVQALGEAFAPLAELKASLGDLATGALRRVTDAVVILAGWFRGQMADAVKGFRENIDELRIAVDTVDNFFEKLGQHCDQLGQWIEEELAGALTSLKATVEDWGASFQRVFGAAIDKVEALLSKLSGVGSAIKGAFNSAVGAVSGLVPDSWKGGGDEESVSIPGLPDEKGGSALPSWMTGVADDFKGSYQQAQADLAASKAKAKAAEDKAKADALKKDADRMVSTKTYAEPEEDANKGTQAHTAAVDEGAEAEKRYQMLLDITRGKLAAGDISQAQADAENIQTTRDYIANLTALQAKLSPTSDKYQEMTVRIYAARAALVTLGEGQQGYQQALDATKAKLDAGLISQGQAYGEDRATYTAQITQLRQVQSTVGQTSAAYQKLETQINKLTALKEQTTVFGQITATFRKVINAWGDLGKNASEWVSGTMNSGISAVSQGLTGLITKTGNWKETMLSAVNSMIGGLIELGVKTVAHYALTGQLMSVQAAMGIATTQSVAAAQVTAGGEILAAHAPAAAATSVSSYGVAAVVGAVLAIAAIGAIIALLAGGFAEGGLIPGGPSHRDNRIAHVATGEYIVRTAAVQHYGVGLLEMINSMGFPLSAPAYAAGGLVGAGPAMAGGGRGAGRGIVNKINVGGARVTLIQPNTRQAMHEAMKSAQGDAIILDAVARNKHVLGIRS